MEIIRTYCEDCGYKLKPNWLFCVRCGNNLTENQPILCDACHHVINDPNPNFCPFCRFQIQEKQPSPPIVIESTPTIQIPKKPEPVSLLPSENRITVKTFFSSIKLDIKAMMHIANDRSFTFSALVLIFLTGVSYIITTYFLELIFNEGTRFELDVYIGGAIFQCSLLLMMGIFGNIITSILQGKTNNGHFVRLMGSYAPLFLLKDIFMLFLIFYVNFFQPGSSGYYIAYNLFNSALIILIIYLFVCIIVFTRYLTQTSTSVSTSISVIIYIMSFTFITSFLLPTIRLIEKMLT